MDLVHHGEGDDLLATIFDASDLDAADFDDIPVRLVLIGHDRLSIFRVNEAPG